MSEPKNYTCNDYRQEMILLALQLRLTKESLPESEKEIILGEIHRLETSMNLK